MKRMRGTAPFPRLLALLFCLLALASAPVRAGGRIPADSVRGGGCGYGDAATMAEIARRIEGYPAVAEDALLCGRDPDAAFTPSGRGTRRVRLPDFCGWYKVTLVVEATIPDYAPGYPANHDCSGFLQDMERCHTVGMTVFEPDPTDAVHRNMLQCCCGTRPVRMEMDLVVGGGAEFTLTPACGSFYPLPATEVSVSVKHVEPFQPCPQSAPSVSTKVDCARFMASLGANALGHSAGCLFFEFDEPSADAFRRNGLSFSWDSSDGEALLVGDDTEDDLYRWNPSYCRFESLADGTAAAETTAVAPRRLHVHGCVVDLADVQDGYEIRYYLPSQVALPAGGVLPAPTGEPFRAWRVRNPSGASGSLDAIEVSELGGGSPSTLEYDSATGSWSRRTGTGDSQVLETVGSLAEGVGTLYFRESRDASGNVVSRRSNLCRAFAWGDEVVEERTGLSSLRTTTYEYYDDAETDGDNYGLLKETVEWDGSWTRYTYDEDGRVATVATPWLDSPRGTHDTLCRVVEHVYSDEFPQETAIERICGVEVSRTYSGWFDGGEEYRIRASAQGASWDADGNELSRSQTVLDSSSPFFGETSSRNSSDGTALQRVFTRNADGTWTVVTSEGRLGGGSSIVSGTRTEELCASDGKVLSRTVADIGSGLTTADDEYELDDFGRTVRTVHADGTSETVEYGCCGPVREVSRDGSETLLGYDSAGRLSFRAAGGTTVLRTYDAAGRLAEEIVLGSRGGTLSTRYEYDEYGERTAVVSPGGLRTEYRTEMVGGHRVETVVRPDGGTEVTTYHLDGSVASVGGTAMAARQYLYSVGSDGTMTTRTIYADGTWEESASDFLGRTVETSWSDGASSSLEYDDEGRVAKSTSAGGMVTLRTYNDSQYGDISAVDMDGNDSLVLYGTDLAEASKTDYVERDGVVMRRTRNWRWQSDYSSTPILLSQTLESVGGLLSIRESMGRAVRTETALQGGGAYTVTTTADGTSSSTVMEYRDGRLVRAESGVDGVVLYDYDQFGRRVGMSVLANGTTLRQRDTLDADGRTTASALSADGKTRTTRYTYDGAGRQASETRPDGTAVFREYDAMGNLVLESGDAYRVAYTYDSRGSLASMETFRTGEANGDRTSWTYDARGRMVRKTYADGTHVDCAYDADGNMLSRTSARGTVATYAYDRAGRLTAVSFPDGTPSLAFSYDRGGRLVSVTDAAGTRTLSYDANGGCLSESLPHVAGKSVVRTFDALGRRTGISLGTDLSATYAYDGFGRVSSVASGENTVVLDYRAHGYALAGRRWLRNGQEVAGDGYAYDAWGDVAGISFGAPDGEASSMGYGYDALRRRTRTDLPDGTSWLYGYDRLSQVVSGERVDADGTALPGGSFLYAYDGIGNRTFSQDGAPSASRRYSSNALNQYTAVATTGYIPLQGRADEDARVAVTVTVDGHSETFTPARDGQEFSVDIPVDNSSGDVTATIRVDALKPGAGQDPDLVRSLSGEYAVSAAVPETPAYDADGNMLSNDGWTYAWNAQDRLVSAAKGTVRLEFAYDYMGRRFEKKVYEGNTLARHRLYAYDGFKQIAEYDALSNNALASTYVWQPAGLDVPQLRNGSEFCISDANKNIVALIDANGTVTDTYIYDPFGNCTHTGTSSNPFRFSSEVHDDETGLVYYNYRYYSPRLGRWIRRDPIGERGGVNLYCNVNDTSNRYDEYGLITNVSAWTSIERLKQKNDNELKCVKCKYIIIYNENSNGKFASNEVVEELKNKLNSIIKGRNCESKVIITSDDSVDNWKKILQENTCICGLFYIGHAGDGILFLQGKGENISVVEGAEVKMGVHRGQRFYEFYYTPQSSEYFSSFSTSFVESLPRQNILPCAEISLFGCYTSYGRNISKAFANHFGVPVLGSRKKLNFDGGTPYTPWYKGGSEFTLELPEYKSSNTIPEECKCR